MVNRLLLPDLSLLRLSFFLSGTTWVTEIVWQIYNNGQISGESILCRVPFLEMATHKHFLRNDLKTLPSPRLIKSHLPYSIIPKSSDMNTQCKYIYIVRNPKDVAVSFFHFEESRKAYDDEYNGPWEFFSKLFMNGNGKFSCWVHAFHQPLSLGPFSSLLGGEKRMGKVLGKKLAFMDLNPMV